MEGDEDYVMKGFPFQKYDISLVNIETVTQNLRTALIDSGFRMVTRFEDELWAHTSIKNELNSTVLDEYKKSLKENDPVFE